ncbi:kynurenine-oxoglutarate transaminase [Aphelenchoides avenae]|nr:kynurenine-oxoglutarate transaminase [Aphelenchus avenae]
MATTPPAASRHVPSQVVRDSSTSIWVEFTTLAAECKAVNLGQGFPDSPMPQFMSDFLAEIARHPERTDWHQYTRGYGHPRLVAALSKLYSRLLGVPVNPTSDILVTVGAYLALYYTMLGWLNPGDEVIVLEPAYDSYVPQVRMAGGVPVPIVMELPRRVEDHTENEDDRAEQPAQPTGKLFTAEELAGIAELATKHDLIVLSDEVYEWHVYPGREMIRFASLPGMYDRTITVGSAGKAFSVTGWKLGWAMGPDWLLEPLKKIHQNCVFTCSTPTQEGIAQAFEKELALMESGRTEESYLLRGLAAELLPKRDRLADYLHRAGFSPIVPDAGYFMMADFSHLDGPFKEPGADPLDYRFVRWLCRDKKLATIPPSAFYSPEHKAGNDHLVRLCFFKKDETLDAAEDILRGFFSQEEKKKAAKAHD